MDQWGSQGLNEMNGFKATRADDSAVSVTPMRKEISGTKTVACFLHKNFSKNFGSTSLLFKTGVTPES